MKSANKGDPMIKELIITNLETAQKVLQIQIPSYKIEAEIIGYYDIPPLTDTELTLQKCGELFFGYYIDEELAGAISYKVEEDTIDIHRLIVHPSHFRKGIAKALIQHVVSQNKTSKNIVVSTGSLNTPATTLYLQLGFKEDKRVQVHDKLSLTFFKKTLG